MNDLPSGTVTFLFTDIEGSTKLAQEHPDKWELFREQHHSILREAIESNKGYVFQIIGDAFCAAFHKAGDALQAALQTQTEFLKEARGEAVIKVRMGIHTGEAELKEDGQYNGYLTMSRVQRLMSAGHGGQVLISTATQELIRDKLPKETSLRDLGEKRLKDLIRPERLYQLVFPGLIDGFPPLKTLDLYRHNLPTQLTTFIGREKEIAEVRHELRYHRLVTLTGSGGTGKTRLALQVAADVLDSFPDGVWFIELAPILDPMLVPRTTAITIGLRAEPQRPIIDMLCDYLHKKQLLIVLDNCEHLVDACAQMADRLLHASTHTRILASSREALGIAGEVTYRVPSLGLPDLNHLPALESLGQYEAVKLFMDRATSAVSTFRVTNENASAIAQICHQLDGIPLAIELAAAKIRVLSVEQIAKRLDDRFRLLTGGSRTALERHQTLRAAIDWSYNLLPPAEQVLLRRLSIFVNGWALEAAESICGDASTSLPEEQVAPLRPGSGLVQSDDVLNLMEQLINKSLVIRDEAQDESRYSTLETMRQYANEKLVESGESDALRNRHLDYFLTLAETAAPHLIRPEQLEWLAQLDADYENLRAALEWALSKKTAELSLRLCAALGRYWYIRTFWLEGSNWLKSALSKTAQNSTPAEKAARVKALYQDAELAQQLDTLDREKTSAEMSLTLAREGSDKRDAAIARFGVAVALYRRGDVGNARPVLEQSITEFQELNDLYWESQSYRLLSDILVDHGELKYTEKTLRNLELARKAGERLSLADALLNYSYMLFVFNRIDEARRSAEEADILFRQIGSNISSTSFLFARIARINGDYEESRSFYMEMQERFGLLGEKGLRAGMILELGLLTLEQGDLDPAHAYFEEALATSRELGYKPYIPIIASCLAGLSNIFYLQGNIERFKENFRESVSLAKEIERHWKIHILVSVLKSIHTQLPESSARILGSLDNSQRESDIPIDPLNKLYYNRAETHTRQKLGDAAFESAFAEGQKMSLDDALDLAMNVVEEM